MIAMERVKNLERKYGFVFLFGIEYEEDKSGCILFLVDDVNIWILDNIIEFCLYDCSTTFAGVHRYKSHNIFEWSWSC